MPNPPIRTLFKPKILALYILTCLPAFLFIQMCLALHVSWGWFLGLGLTWVITEATADTARERRNELLAQETPREYTTSPHHTRRHNSQMPLGPCNFDHLWTIEENSDSFIWKCKRCEEQTIMKKDTKKGSKGKPTKGGKGC